MSSEVLCLLFAIGALKLQARQSVCIWQLETIREESAWRTLRLFSFVVQGYITSLSVPIVIF
jgi:hypothetical protein